MEQSHIDPTTPLEPPPLEHWRTLWKEQAERHATSRPRRFVLPCNRRLLPPDLLRAHLRRVEQQS